MFGIKFSITFIFITLTGTFLIAQSYIPLLDPAADWQDSFTSADPGPGVSQRECYLYYLEGDTFVNDTLYQVLRKTGSFQSTQVEPPFNSWSSWYSGSIYVFLREDSAARKVFIREPSWPPSFPEALLYDFSVGLGPYPWTWRYPDSGMIVTAVDTIVLVNGPHRRITLNTWIELIEGIGSLGGFMPKQSTINTSYVAGGMVCHTLDGIPDHVVPDNCACGSNVGIQPHSFSGLQVSPSPTRDFCQLRGAPPDALFRVRSMDGRMLCTGRCSIDGTATIDLVDFKSAMYVVEVLDPLRYFRLSVIKE